MITSFKEYVQMRENNLLPSQQAVVPNVFQAVDAQYHQPLGGPFKALDQNQALALATKKWASRGRVIVNPVLQRDLQLWMRDRPTYSVDKGV